MKTYQYSKKIIYDLEEINSLALQITQLIKDRALITLRGNFGCGKTTLASAIINSLSRKPQKVPSLSFPILKVYKTQKYQIFHYDLYRIKNIHELEEIQFYTILQKPKTIAIIEWPEIIQNIIDPDLDCEIYDVQNEEKKRVANIHWK